MSRFFVKNQLPNTRKEKLNLIRMSGQVVTHDYLEFGQDYYDNKNILQGFGSYKYDGRYEESVKKFISEISFNKILDFGCAKGFLLYEFYKKGKSVIGIEKSDYARNNSKPEMSDFLFKDFSNISDENLCDVDVIISRDVLPHLSQVETEELLKFISLKCSRIKLVYLEFPVSSESCSREDLLDWDPTHKVIENKEYWDAIFSNYKLPIETCYKNIFE